MLINAVETVVYIYLSTVVIGGILVNCGVMMILDILEIRMLGAITLVLGLVLLTVTVFALQQPSGSSVSSADPANPVEIRTPVVDGLTVRAGPGTDYDSATGIWQVNRGDKLRVVEDTLGWIRFRVKYFDPEWSGWVAKDYTTVWETYQEIKRIDQLDGDQRRPVRGD